MIEMKNNNYFSMFKDAVIMICVFLYGTHLASSLTPSPRRTDADHLRHRAARVAGGRPQRGRLLDGQEGPSVGGEFRVSDANGDLYAPWFFGSHVVVLLPVISHLCGTKQACIVLSLIQVVILACHPIVSTLSHVSFQSTITVLYSVISSFHIIRSILFKYPFRTPPRSLTPLPSSCLSPTAAIRSSEPRRTA